MKRTDRRSDCPVNFAVQTFGDAWSLLIVRDLVFGSSGTYSDFLASDEGMASNILAHRLAHLRRHGLIRKRGTGKGARYALTPKGLDLVPVVLELISWSARYDRRTGAPPEFVARIRKNRRSVEAELRRSLARHAT